jgi:hypothetical protein
MTVELHIFITIKEYLQGVVNVVHCSQIIQKGVGNGG